MIIPPLLEIIGGLIAGVLGLLGIGRHINKKYDKPRKSPKGKRGKR